MDAIRHITYLLPEVFFMADDIIENNLKETAKVTSDPRYIMSAATAWLRKYEERTLRHLQESLDEMGIMVKLTCELYTRKADYDLCVPGFHRKPLELKYLVNFVLNPVQLSRIVQKEEDLQKLELAGYSCAKGYDANLAAKQRPTLQQLNDQGDIFMQLQWAAVKSAVTTFKIDPESLMHQDIERHLRKPHKKPIIWRPQKREMVYSYFNDEKEQITEFGEVEQLDDYNNVVGYKVVFLPSYLHDAPTPTLTLDST